VQGALPTLYAIHISRFILIGNGPQGIIRKAEEEEEKEERNYLYGNLRTYYFILEVRGSRTVSLQLGIETHWA
jgi:hypothetical protein